jgi:hypothetical protein
MGTDSADVEAKPLIYVEVFQGQFEPVSTSGMAIGPGMLKFLHTCVPTEMLNMVSDEKLFKYIVIGKNVKGSDHLDPREVKLFAAVASQLHKK